MIFEGFEVNDIHVGKVKSQWLSLTCDIIIVKIGNNALTMDINYGIWETKRFETVYERKSDTQQPENLHKGETA